MHDTQLTALQTTTIEPPSFPIPLSSPDFAIPLISTSPTTTYVPLNPTIKQDRNGPDIDIWREAIFAEEILSTILSNAALQR